MHRARRAGGLLPYGTVYQDAPVATRGDTCSSMYGNAGDECARVQA